MEYELVKTFREFAKVEMVVKEVAEFWQKLP